MVKQASQEIQPGTDLGANDKTIPAIRQGPKTSKCWENEENRANRPGFLSFGLDKSTDAVAPTFSGF
jgi:hypothetical protein